MTRSCPSSPAGATLDSSMRATRWVSPGALQSACACLSRHADIDGIGAWVIKCMVIVLSHLLSGRGSLISVYNILKRRIWSLATPSTAP